MPEIDIIKLSPVLHSPVRIGIMSVLITNIEADFNFLKKSTGATDGNLSSHLSKLEKLGFIKIEKSFSGKKPRTTCSATTKGTKEFKAYINVLENIIQTTKGKKN